MIMKIVSVVSRHKLPVTLWIKNQALRFETKMPDFSPTAKLMSFELAVEITDQQFNEELQKNNTDEILGSFQVDTVMFFFKSKCWPKKEKDWLKVDVPSVIYKMQRRADMRIPQNRAVAPKVTFLDPTKPYSADQLIRDSDIMAFRVLDLSVGGLGFAAKVEQKDAFKNGTVLKDVRFKFRGVEIITEGIVRHAIETLSDQNKPILKVGIQFQRLRAEYGKIIFQYVLEESRKLFQLLH